MYRKFALLIGVIIVARAAACSADDFLLSELYGNGVHAYNSHDFNTAYNQLTSAIQGGTIDPRAYYFRGLTEIRLGRMPEAAADFQKGAEMETGDSNDVFPVSTSLVRIQGPEREMLEKYREAARVTAHQRQESLRQARYQQRIEAEKTVLRKVQPTELMPTPGASAEAASQPVPAAQPSAAPAAQPAAAPANVADPFAEPKPVPVQNGAKPTKPEEAPKSDDPFGVQAQPAPQTTPQPAVTPATKPVEPPKEAPKPASAGDADPFGGPAATPKPAPAAGGETKPAPQPAPAEDPFK